MPATAQPATASVDSAGSGDEPITVSSNIAGTDTVTVAAGDMKNEMPDKEPGDSELRDDSIVEKSITQTKANTQMNTKDGGDVEKTGSEATAEVAVSKEPDDKESIESVTDQVKTLNMDDDSKAPATTAEPTTPEKNDSSITAGHDEGTDKSTESEVTETTESKPEEDSKKEES
ncbi:hypothetical protein [Endozoicomonas sp. SCSIO W0465]|uniref:hypothetical protein n=1 Tax=Endozoicomonas sp. SCSIO W0465 TaxID=2918516 RepID=UPI0020750C2A|nr:hypothetical protein [Endozoicomonas sp. SCSIO W0465]USE33863.1 hypothetical protein MJO57_16965 [Endozoicomonas sp. SCSIO W0465]